MEMTEKERADRLESMIDRMSETNVNLKTHVSNLLAVIHRDGGHYENEHGTEMAVADALIKIPLERRLAEQLVAAARTEALSEAAQSGAVWAIECADELVATCNTRIGGRDTVNEILFNQKQYKEKDIDFAAGIRAYEHAREQMSTPPTTCPRCHGANVSIPTAPICMDCGWTGEDVIGAVMDGAG